MIRRDDLPVALYRMYDAAGDLLYVGQSHDPCTRLLHHRCLAEWALQVARIDVEWHPNKAIAIAAETAAIAADWPKHNIAHNRRVKRTYPRQNAGPILAAWLEKNGKLPRVFAAEIGVKPERIERLIACEVNAVRGIGYAIERATGGEIHHRVWDCKSPPQPARHAPVSPPTVRQANSLGASASGAFIPAGAA